MKKIPLKILLLLIMSIVVFHGVFFNVNATTKLSDEGFWIKFIDVGQGDATLIQCDGQYMLIDGGPPEASSVVYTILKDNKIDKLDYIVATHADADHIGGLSGALNYSKVAKCYCPVAEHDTKTFLNLVKYLNNQNVAITVPKNGNTFKLGSADVTVIGPVGKIADTNNSSIVIRMVYGKNSFIFMGDAEYEEESQIIRNYKNIYSDLIKIGHHGSALSTSQELLAAISPKYAVISVGQDNSYGHPVQEILDRINATNATIYRTDLQGDITVISDGKKLTITTEKNASEKDIDTKESVEIPNGTTFVLNTSSKRFHTVDCKSVNQMRESNRAYSTDSAEALIDNGYKPCGNCQPSTVSNSEANVKEEKRNSSASEGSILYVLNTNSKKFHLPSCGSVSDMNSKNRQDVSMYREEIISKGYNPCKRCNP